MTHVKELAAREPYGMCMNIFSLLIVLVLVTVFTPNMSPAKDSLCSSIDVRIRGGDADLDRVACTTAVSHFERLGSCGLFQSEHIDISITENVTGAPANCVGAFHCATSSIEVLSPDSLKAFALGDFMYAGLEPETIFETVLRHELGHALLYQTLAGREIGLAAHEYIAYALQIDAMSPNVRTVFLKTNDAKPPQNLDIFNALIAGFAPGKFAAKAWLHFSQSEHGCDFIGKLVAGDIVLGAHVGP